MRGIFGAWLVALLVWMLHAGATPLAEAILIRLTTSMIYLGGFSHSVAGAVEGLYLANTGVITYVQWALNFQVPVTLGNALGGRTRCGARPANPAPTSRAGAAERRSRGGVR